MEKKNPLPIRTFHSYVVIGVILVLGAILSIFIYQNQDRRKEMIHQFLRTEGVRIIRFLEINAIGQEVSPDQNLLAFISEQFKSIISDPEIAYLALMDGSGKFLVHTLPQMEGKSVPYEIKIYKVLFEGKVQIRENVPFDQGYVFEVIKSFEPYPKGTSFKKPPPIEERLGMIVGLKMDRVQAISSDDLNYFLLLTLVLISLGTASIYFLFITQNYRIVNLSLDRMKKYTENITESIETGLIALDQEDKVITFNKTISKMFALNEREVRGKKLNTLIDNDKYAEFLKIIYSGENVHNQEINLLNIQGEEIPMSLTISPLTSENGIPMGKLIALNDLSEIKSLKEKIERSEKLAAVARLAAAVAHEIRNPLNSIRGYAQFLKDKMPLSSKEREYTEIMIKEVERLNKVVGELIHLTRPVELDYTLANINEVISESLNVVSYDAELQKIRIEKNLADDIPDFYVDVGKIKQVLLNLYLNAIASMPDGGTLLVTSRLEKEKKIKGQPVVVIEVEDTGAGIPKEHISRLFEPFFTTRANGAGLGLAISHKIVESMNGRIDFYTEEKRGTRFFIELPLKLSL